MVKSGQPIYFPISPSRSFERNPKVTIYVLSRINFHSPLGLQVDLGSRGYAIVPRRLWIFYESSSNPRLMLSDRVYHVKQLYLSSQTEHQSSNFITIFHHPLINDLSFGSCESLENLSISAYVVTSLKLPYGVST